MHPDIDAHTEMFNPDWTKDHPFDENTPEETILNEHIFTGYDPDKGASGFILHRSGARFGNWPRLWKQLEEDTDLHVISLYRHNLLERYISYLTMKDRNRKIPLQPKHFPAKELQAEFERYEKELASFDQRFAKHPMMKVSYEELCSDYEAVLTRIQVFLGVRARSLKPGTVQSESFSPQKAISNFEELGEHFRNTRWAWFFKRKESFQSGATLSVEL